MKLFGTTVLLALITVLPSVGWAKARCDLELRGISFEDRIPKSWRNPSHKGMVKDITESVENTVDFVDRALTIPSFIVIFQGRYVDNRQSDTWADILDGKIYLANATSPGKVAHEIGHLLFIQVLKEQAPKAYAALMAELASANENAAEDPDGVGALINSYAEQFCDFLSLLVTGKTSIFDGEAGVDTNGERDWAREFVMPWEETVNPRNSYDRNRSAQYSRMRKFRRVLMHEYREELFAGVTRRRRILQAVTEAMAASVEKNYKWELSDKKLNRDLIKRMRKALDKAGVTASPE